MSPEDARQEGTREALERVKGMALLPALDLLLQDADESARAMQAAAAAQGQPDPLTLLRVTGAFGMAAGLRLAATVATDRAYGGE